MKAMERLLEIMVRLRDPEDGCPWDREQDFASIAPYTIEEAYEVDDAIRRGDMEDLLGELGDLLLQVVYHAQLAHEAGHFDFNRVAEGIAEKLVRRHPHVFEAPGTRSLEEVHRSWEATKAEERRDRAARRNATSDPLGGVAEALPALMRAAKLQGRAKADLKPPSAEALKAELAQRFLDLSAEPEAAGEELGDALFAAVALARALDVDPERALRDANARFEGRFRADKHEGQDEEEGA